MRSVLTFDDSQQKVRPDPFLLAFRGIRNGTFNFTKNKIVDSLVGGSINIVFPGVGDMLTNANEMYEDFAVWIAKEIGDEVKRIWDRY